MACLDRQTGRMTNQPDPRPLLSIAIDLATSVVSNVRPDQYELPTPCAEFNVGELLGHMVAVLERLTIIGSLGDPNDASRLIDVTPETVGTEWSTRADKVRAVWADPTLLRTMVTVPWGQVPGGAACAAYISEITTHSWDLATATGQQVQWADDVCRLSLMAMKMALPPELPRDAEIPFGQPVAVSDDAPLIEQLVAWTGRRP